MPQPYLSICAIYRWEGDYLREWVAFHRLVGVERFFLYDNLSDDQHREALRPYIEDGTVELTDWPMFPGQVQAYNDCIERHREDSRWIAFIDIDEFLFSPTELTVPEALSPYERWPGVGVNRVTFGTSGHETRQPGLVLENYTRRLEFPNARSPGVKSIVDPRRTVRAHDPHEFEFADGHGVDETELPLDGPRAQTDARDVLRVNHYFTRSNEERLEKLERPRAGGGELRPEVIRPRQGIREDRRFGVEDDAILSYLPALRKELARVAA
jgi:Glycosyltransferase family 92